LGANGVNGILARPHKLVKLPAFVMTGNLVILEERVCVFSNRENHSDVMELLLLEEDGVLTDKFLLKLDVLHPKYGNFVQKQEPNVKAPHSANSKMATAH
jgi:hypothetical protein